MATTELIYEIKDNKITDELFGEIKNGIYRVRESAKGNSPDPIAIILTGPGTLLDQLAKHGKVTITSNELYGTTSHFAQIDDIKLTAIISKVGTMDSVTVKGLVPTQVAFSMRAGK